MITVFTSCWNQGKYLPQAIESVLNQTWKNFQYLIFDDGSTDNTWEVIQKYAKRDKRIVPIRIPKTSNVGVVINMSIQKTIERFWVWCPADDVLLPGCLTIKHRCSELVNHEAIFYSHWQHIDEKSEVIKEHRVEAIAPHEFSKIIWERCPIGFTGIWIPMYIFDKVGFFPEHLPCSEDYYWMVKATIHGVSFCCAPEVLYQKRLHTNRTTHRSQAFIQKKVKQIREELRNYAEGIGRVVGQSPRDKQ